MAADIQTFMQDFVEAAPDAIIGVDAEGRIGLVNGQAVRLFGYARDELLGRQVEMLVPDAVRAVHARHREHYDVRPAPRRMGEADRLELSARRKDGTEFPAEISLSTVEIQDGLRVLAAVRDIGHRRRAEDEMRAMLDAAPDAIVGVDVEGRIVLANAQVERLFGHPRQELLGRRIEMLVPESARMVHGHHRTRYLADPIVRPMGHGMELSARRKDGTEFPAEISLSAVETDEGLRVLAAVRDVSERKLAEAERDRLRELAEHERAASRSHQSQRLESLGQLAGGVAHDFNNLLAVITNYAAFVHEQIEAATLGHDDVDWQVAHSDIQQIERAARRASELTRQLLTFGRREVVRLQIVDLNHVVTDVESLLRRTLGEHVELLTSLQPGAWPIKADPGQLEQVLVNLAVNARDAMPTGGTLSITTGNLIITPDFVAEGPAMTPGAYVRLQVSDTGTGMSREVLRQAFDPFFTTKPRGSGTGLGLATVYGIIAQADGHAHIYSEAGLGTTFNAYLPAIEQESILLVPEPGPQGGPAIDPCRKYAGGGETVLLVEDEEAIREVARRLLSRNGYQVVTAADAVDAVEIARRHSGRLDLLLTDVIMPVMFGKEVAEKVTALRPGIRVLYMSGYAQPVLASQGTLDPGVTLVEKPFTEDTLLLKVRDVLEGSAGRASEARAT